MTARDVYASSVASAHASAETGNITNLGIAAVGNNTGWSRAIARAALSSGAITSAQFVSVMTAIESWESSQIQAAKDTLRATGDTAPA